MKDEKKSSSIQYKAFNVRGSYDSFVKQDLLSSKAQDYGSNSYQHKLHKKIGKIRVKDFYESARRCSSTNSSQDYPVVEVVRQRTAGIKSSL